MRDVISQMEENDDPQHALCIIAQGACHGRGISLCELTGVSGHGKQMVGVFHVLSWLASGKQGIQGQTLRGASG